MAEKTLKGVYFQIQTNFVKKSKKRKANQSEEAPGETFGTTPESTSEQSPPGIHTLTGAELSGLIDGVLNKKFTDRFLGAGEYALAGHNDTIISDMTSIPEDSDNYRYFLFTKRRSDAPTQTKIKNDGSIEISPIEIASGSFISETTLVMLNIETGVILELLNKNTGSTGTLANYLSLCEGKANPDYFEVLPVLNYKKALNRLGVMSMLNKFEFSLSTALLPSVQQQDSLDSLFTAVGNIANNPATKQVKVIMSANKQVSLDKPGIISIIKKILRIQNEKPHGVLRVTGLGPDSKFDVVDFVNDDFLFLLKYKYETRYINTQEVFQYMNNDYRGKLSTIKECIGMVPV